jgi:CHAT domain-containing protein/tetratricopeptide (TPR) repeat protein
MESARLSISKVAHSYLYHFEPLVARPITVLATLPTDQQRSQQVAEQFAHLAGFLNHTLIQRQPTPASTTSAQDLLATLGRQIYNHWLPRPIQQALATLPPGTPLTITSNEHDLPWELAHDGVEHLALRYNVARQLTVAALPPSRPTPPRPWACLLIGNPTGDLPAAAQEIRGIAELLTGLPNTEPPRILMRQRAQKRVVLQELARGTYDLIHFSGHATFIADNPTASGLILADGEILTVAELERSVAGQPFIFLNACESGRAATEDLTPTYFSRGAHSLASAFLQSGALGVLGSFWPMLDAGSAAAALAFYQAVLTGAPVGAALRTARSTIRQANPLDPVWAAYLLYGQPTLRLLPIEQRETRQVTVLALRLDSLLTLYTQQSLTLTATREAALRALVQTALQRYGGQLMGSHGDHWLVYFGLPSAFEDSALRALYAALAVQEAVRSFAQQQSGPLSSPLTLHIGISTTPVIVQRIMDQHTLDTWTTSNGAALAARLATHAGPGEIWLDEKTRLAVQLQVITQSAGVLTLAPDQQLTMSRVVALRANEASDPGAAPTLIGRAAELADLHRWWGEAAAGQGRLVDLSGAPGVGKSHLLQALRVRLSGQPQRWLTIQCQSFDQEHAYALLAQVIRELAGLSASDPSAAQQTKLTTLLELALPPTTRQEPDQLPELVALLSHTLGLSALTAALEKIDARLRQQRLAALLRLLLAHDTNHTPLVLVLEDLHWADEASLAVLRPLIPVLGTVRLLLIAVYRPDYSPAWPASTVYRQLPLAPLAAADQHQLLATLLTTSAPPGLADYLLTQTAGNPLFLISIVHELRERQWLLQTDEGWRLSAPLALLPLPTTLESLIQARLDRLMTPSRELLQQAAVIGQEFEHAVLAELPATAPAETLANRVDELTRRQFIQVTLNLTLTYAFSHALVQQTIYYNLLDQLRRLYHRLVALAWQRLYGERQPHQLAHHYYHSDDRLQAIRYALAAGHHAAGAWDNANAIRWYTRALERIHSFGEQPTTEIEEEQGASPRHLAHWQATALTGRGDAQAGGGANPAAIVDYQAALGLTGTALLTTEEQAALHRKLAIAYHDQSQYEPAAAALAVGLALVGDAASGEAGRLQIWRGMISVRRGDYAAGLAACQQALALVQPSALAADLAKVYNLLGIIHRRQGRSADAIAVLEQNITLCEAAGYKVGLARALSNLACVLQDLGRWDEAVTYSLRSATLCQQTGDMRQQAAVALDLGEIYRRRGALAEALTVFGEAQQLAEQYRFPDIQGMALINQAATQLQRGDDQSAARLLQAGQQVLAANGDDMYTAEVLRYQAELALRTGRMAAATELAHAAFVKAQEQQTELDTALAERLLGRLAQQTGQWATAEQHFTNSLATLRRQHSPHEVGLTLLALAQLSATQPEDAGGAATERAQAATYCSEAIALFKQLGASLDLAAAQALSRELDAQ